MRRKNVAEVIECVLIIGLLYSALFLGLETTMLIVVILIFVFFAHAASKKS